VEEEVEQQRLNLLNKIAQEKIIHGIHRVRSWEEHDEGERFHQRSAKVRQSQWSDGADNASSGVSTKRERSYIQKTRATIAHLVLTFSIGNRRPTLPWCFLFVMMPTFIQKTRTTNARPLLLLLQGCLAA
jgi:hypothetical protein